MGRLIENPLYCIRRYDGYAIFYETDSVKQLAKFVAEYEVKGNIVTSITEIRTDGSKPRVPIKSTSYYKKMIKELIIR